MSAQLLLLLLLLGHSNTAVYAQSPGPPPSCTPDIISSIDWGAGTGAYGVSLVCNCMPLICQCRCIPVSRGAAALSVIAACNLTHCTAASGNALYAVSAFLLRVWQQAVACCFFDRLRVQQNRVAGPPASGTPSSRNQVLLLVGHLEMLQLTSTTGGQTARDAAYKPLGVTLGLLCVHTC